MKLEATEDDIYRLMDRRGHCLYGIILCGIMAAVSVCYLVYGKKCWDILYLLTVFCLGICFLAYRVWSIGRRIMETEGCYLELEPDCLVVRQPEADGRYECCRIFYGEIEKIVEGSRRGVPGFYVVMKKMGEERKSFMLLDGREREQTVFYVRSLGYGKQEFTIFYRKLLQNLPDYVAVLGTEQQEIWKMKKTYTEAGMAVGMALAYVVPKIIEIAGLL